VEAFINPRDGRSHVIRLSEQGRALRERLDGIIRQAAPIAQPPVLSSVG
jgi:DNA-binding MarR family transcriptional regulator